MKKQNLQENEKELPKKVSWNTFREMNLDTINEILEAHGRLLVFTIKGDFFEVKQMEF